MNIINTKFDDFIGIYSNVFPEGFCSHVINEFERLNNNGLAVNRQQSENSLAHVKNDEHIFLNLKCHSTNFFHNNSISNIFFKGLQHCYDNYSEKFSSLRDGGSLRASHLKMQKTAPGGGYHVWHYEHGPNEASARTLVYMLYLNTLKVEECGETEFLYQQKRYIPTENTLLLWPASYTHTHRGNPVYGQTSKYIITGWFYYD